MLSSLQQRKDSIGVLLLCAFAGRLDHLQIYFILDLLSADLIIRGPFCVPGPSMLSSSRQKHLQQEPVQLLLRDISIAWASTVTWVVLLRW